MKILSLLIIAGLSLLSPKVNGQNLNGIPELLDSFEKDQGFNGVVLIAKGDEILFQKGYGFSDQNSKVKTDKNTIYQIASTTKTFTAAAIIKLVEENKLKLTDSLGKFFPKAPADKTGITIHQLLTHYSGLPQAFVADGEKDQEKAAAKILKVKLELKPGKNFIYSNGNFLLLGIIIEKVTGKRWKDNLKKTIIEPAGMQQTYFWAEKNKTGLPQAEPLKPIKMHYKDYVYRVSTGNFTSAHDIYIFLKFLTGNQFLTPASKALLFGKNVDLYVAKGDSTFYSYGLFRTAGRLNSIWLRGNEEWFGTSIAYYFPEKAVTVFVWANHEKLKNGEKAHNFISGEIIKRIFPSESE
jgi:CubicO group peptidase (beta-lactamase class C family)